MNQNTTSFPANTRFKIHLGLIDKYDRTINRFRMGPIHYLIYNYTHSIPYLAAKDIAYLSNVTQFMRRYYKFTTDDGKNQLTDRIKLLGQYYQNGGNRISYEYPTMFITKTHKIFKGRLKMIQKMKPIDLSSEVDSSVRSRYEPQQTSYFLNSLNHSITHSLSSTSLLCQKLIKSINLRSQSDIEYSIYNVYNGKSDEYFYYPRELLEQLQASRFIIDQRNMNHLICDFDDVDQEYLQKQLQIKRKMQEKPKSTAIQIFSISDDQENQNFSSQVPKTIYPQQEMQIPERRKQMRGHLRDRLVNKYLTTRQRDLEETQRNRGMIKKKAQNLLRRIQNQDYTNYTIPYDE